MHVSANLLTTLNGKIASSHAPTQRIGSAQDYSRMLSLRAQHDCVVMGAQTARVGCQPIWLTADKKQFMPTVILTRTGTFSPTLPIFQTPKDKLWFCSSQHSPPIHGYPLIPASSDHLKDMLSAIAKTIPANRLLIEGGGKVLAACIRENLIHTLYLTIHTSLLDDAKAIDLIPTLETFTDTHFQYNIQNIDHSTSEIYLTLVANPFPKEMGAQSPSPPFPSS